MTVISKNFVKKLLEKRREDSHKGENGRVLIVGGSKNYVGAPALAALGALRTGADLVYLIVPEKIAGTVASYSPNFIVRSYPGDFLNEKALPIFWELSEKADVLTIGNGLAKEDGVLRIVEELVDVWKKPIVVDADAISPLLKIENKAVVTPHAEELFGFSRKKIPEKPIERKSFVAKTAKEKKCTLLFKAAEDIVSDGVRTATNKTGNAGMTVGGTGDVLAGVTASLLCTNKYFEAACAAAYLNGFAGDLAFKEFGYSLLATDVIEKLPTAILQTSK